MIGPCVFHGMGICVLKGVQSIWLPFTGNLKLLNVIIAIVIIIIIYIYFLFFIFLFSIFFYFVVIKLYPSSPKFHVIRASPPLVMTIIPRNYSKSANCGVMMHLRLAD